MDGSLYYWFGGALVLAALILSTVGVRGRKDWPGSRGLLVGLTALFAVLVVGTAAYGVANAREEQDHRRHEQAQEAEEAAAEAEQGGEEGQGGTQTPAGQEAEAPSPGAPPPPSQGTPPGRGAETDLDVTSPEDGSLSFEPAGLTARAGTITITYTNPSAVPHNIALESDGQAISESDTITESETSISNELAPGEFIFFCTVPGHREGGMEGVLTVE